MEQSPIRGGRQIKPEALTLETAIETLRSAIQKAEREDSEALQLIRRIEDPEKVARLYDEHRARITAAADTARTALTHLEENPADFEVNRVIVENAIEALLKARTQIQPDVEKPIIDTNPKRYV